MTRLLALVVCGLSAFGALLALLIIASRVLGIPMPWRDAMIFSGVAAPFLGWRFERMTLEMFSASFRAGGRHFAMRPGPTLGYGIQSLARLSPADVSVLVMALRHEGPDRFFMMTARGSDNHHTWAALAHLGLMGEIAAEPEVGARPPISSKQFYVTPRGKELIPPLLHAAAVIRKSMPELA